MMATSGFWCACLHDNLTNQGANRDGGHRPGSSQFLDSDVSIDRLDRKAASRRAFSWDRVRGVVGLEQDASFGFPLLLVARRRRNCRLRSSCCCLRSSLLLLSRLDSPDEERKLADFERAPRSSSRLLGETPPGGFISNRMMLRPTVLDFRARPAPVFDSDGTPDHPQPFPITFNSPSRSVLT